MIVGSNDLGCLEHEIWLGFNVETVEYKNISFTVWDVGGQNKGEFSWNGRFCVVVVGASPHTTSYSSIVETLLPEHTGAYLCGRWNDRDRVVQTRDELHWMLNEVWIHKFEQ
ncbi:ADP-ribosylation factor 1-like protein [Tanacetum coccineum]